MVNNKMVKKMTNNVNPKISSAVVEDIAVNCVINNVNRCLILGGNVHRNVSCASFQALTMGKPPV